MAVVTKCVCHDVLFSEMKQVIDRYHLNNLVELQDKLNCANSCKFCIPYINDVFLTGKIAFEVKAIV